MDSHLLFTHIGTTLLAAADSSAHSGGLQITDIGVAVLSATLLGLVAHWLRQPIILAYLIAGAVVGPQLGFGLVKDKESVEIISKIGLILLLFIIGLEMNVPAMLTAGSQLLVAGIGQFLVCAAFGMALFGMVGYSVRGASNEGLYLALLCALSSTAVVVKLLYDKGEIDTLPGRMTLGVLVFQDIYAIFILAFQPNFASPRAGPIIMSILGTVGLLTAGFLFAKFVLKWIFTSIAKAPEMVVAVSIGWCAAVAAAAKALNLSMEMGALVAGICISAFPYSVHVSAKTLPLRDFFLTLFFVSLGMKIEVLRLNMVGILLLIVVFIIVSRFISVYPLLRMTGSGRRTAFVTSLNLAQMSEFSLVIATLGITYGHIDEKFVIPIIYAMAITAVLSSYAIRHNHRLYVEFDKLLTRFGIRQADESTETGHSEHPPVALLGFHRVGRSLIESVSTQSPQLLRQLHIIDFNPETLHELSARGIHATFGDISSIDTLEHSHLRDKHLILCTIPDMLLKGTNNLTLVKTCRGIAPDAVIVATADDPAHEESLLANGADAVIAPHKMAAAQLTGLVKRVVTHGKREARNGMNPDIHLPAQ